MNIIAHSAENTNKKPREMFVYEDEKDHGGFFGGADGDGGVDGDGFCRVPLG